MTSSEKSKIFIVDTSVLLYDKDCFKKMSSNKIVIPLIVLEEIDKFKSREGILGENARYINRFLDDIRKLGNLNQGVTLEEIGVTIMVETNTLWSGIEQLEKTDNDNKIIATAVYVKENLSTEEVILISKDINLRVKCDAIGISSNDYYADYEFIKEDKLYKGYVTKYVETDIINGVYSSKFISINKIDEPHSVCQNEFVILKSSEDESQSSALCIRKGNTLELVKSKKDIYNSLKIEGKNKEQIFALNLLLDENISLITMTGVPGSGKTYLALMNSLNEIQREKKKRIIFTRPIQTVGKDIGFLPGTLNEKMAPWLSPIVDNFRNQFGDLSYFDLMMDKGTIDVAPLSYIRGRSFNDSIIIVDEAQNATVHELKTVITRTGKNSKIILLGDIEQVDLPYINKHSNGLTIIIEKLKNEKLTGHVNFEKGYRSDLANIAAQLL